MSTLLLACAQLRSRWEQKGLPLVGHLRPPVPDKDLREMFERLGVSPCADVLEWWSWHDGVEEGVDPGFGIGPLFSLAQATTDYRVQCDVSLKAATDDRPAPSWWHPQWFPISRAGYGGEVTVDCATAGPDGSDVLMVHFGDDDFWVPKAAGLAQVVTWWVKAWDVGVYTYDHTTGAWGYNWRLLGEHNLPTLGGIV